jgi:hypothetical protein
VQAQTAFPGAPNPAPTGSTTDAAAVAGTAGATTTLPDLVSATLSTDGTFIDYQFDKPLGALPTAGGPGGALGHFESWTSDAFFDNPRCVETATSFQGTTGPCAPNSQLPNNVVRAFFNPVTGPSAGASLPGYDEYAVKAAVTPGAVGSTAAVGNGYGEAPVGDNQGAFASGFTTGPDAFRVTFTTSTNTATVLFDQRVFATTPTSFVLLDANGTPLAGGTGVAAGPAANTTTTPGSYLITVSFTGGSVANAKALEIKGPAASPGVTAAAFTYFNNDEADTVQQIVSPTGSSAILKPGSRLHFVKVALKHSKKHAKHQKKAQHKRSKR